MGHDRGVREDRPKGPGGGSTPLLSHVPELTDGQLLVRSWRIEDIGWLTAACQDPEIQRWTRVPSPYTEADAERFVVEVAPGALERGEAVHAAVTGSGTGDGVGAIGLVLLRDAPGVAELGYWTVPHRRRRGVASGAADLFVDWAFAELELERVELHVDPRNLASVDVARRCGFQLEGVLRSRGVRHGERHDVAIHARLRR